MTIPTIASYPIPTDLPQNRVNWLPDPSRAVLLIHDMQEYFLDFYDSAAAPIPTLIEHIRQLREACDAAGVPVVYTAQPGEQSLKDRALLQEFWGPGLTARPERAPVVAALAPRAGDVVLTKWRYSAFARTDLAERMQAWGRDQLIVCGVYAHIGCQVSATEAFMRDIQPFMVSDAVADFSLDRHLQALDYVAQRSGVVLDTAKTLACLRPAAAAETLPANPAALKADVAALLQIPASDLHDDDNLLFAGLDSIRLMSLIERWRRAGATLAFIDLAERPTLQDWWQLLEASQQG
ncbi:isochorismatase family protein [Chitinimonas lacunae]|uniref:isochorismatase n=1 Tax=Chitinimonas lacunae TaxID=1963018 RepID=A0ABV8MNM1_9NEIS